MFQKNKQEQDSIKQGTLSSFRTRRATELQRPLELEHLEHVEQGRGQATEMRLSLGAAAGGGSSRCRSSHSIRHRDCSADDDYNVLSRS